MVQRRCTVQLLEPETTEKWVKPGNSAILQIDSPR